MTYCAQADLVTRFGNEEMLQLTDPTNTGSINATILGAAQADADAEIDGYLGGRYQLPLTTVPAVLTRIACDLTRYYLYGDVPLTHVRQRYEDAIKFLVGVSKGSVLLGLDTNSQPAVVVDTPEINSVGNTFARPTDPCNTGGAW